MEFPNLVEGQYLTKQRPLTWYARAFPSFSFHGYFLKRIVQDGAVAKRGGYDEVHWVESSSGLRNALENVGVKIEVTGMRHFMDLDGPCVFIGNHMSSLETIVLPGLIQPYRDVTFVVKSSLLKYPMFKHIVGSRDPIVIDRTNPREDLKVILESGVDKLSRGTSIVIFPQSTRMKTFDPTQFNKIGVKLAARAKVPIIPLALKTDAWCPGIYKSDFGKIDPSQRVHFAFGPPIWLQGRGRTEHQAICDFISQNLLAWNATDE